MRAEKRRQRATAEKRFHDAERTGRRRNRSSRDAIVIGTELLQSADQPVGMTNHSSACFVSTIFALTGQAQLQQHRAKRSEKHKQQSHDSPALSVTLITISAEQPTHMSKKRNRPS